MLGVAGACRKYEIATSMFYRWRAKFEAHGASGLEQKAGGSEADREMRALEAENLRLKRLVADKELELQILRDLKKKRHPIETGGRHEVRGKGPSGQQGATLCWSFPG